MDPLLRLASDGLTLAADAYGPEDGPPVVFFHGGGQTRHAWDGTARLLGDKGWRATTVDLRVTATATGPASRAATRSTRSPPTSGRSPPPRPAHRC